MPLLFSYGTLQDPNVQTSLFGRHLHGEPDELIGFECSFRVVDDRAFAAASGRDSHAIVRCNGDVQSRVAGTVFEVSEQELEKADRYEQAGYRRISAMLASGRPVWVYAEDQS